MVLDGTRRQLEDTTALAKRMQGALRDVVAEKEELQTVVAKLQQREGMLKVRP